MKSIGVAVEIDFDGILSWFEGLTCAQAKGIREDICKDLKKSSRTDDDDSIVGACANSLFVVMSWSSHPYTETEEYKWPQQRRKAQERIGEYKLFSEEYGQPINVGRWLDGRYAYLFLGNPAQGIIVCEPEKYMKLRPLKDYSRITPAALSASLLTGDGASATNLVPLEQQTTLTQASLSEQHEDALSRMETLKLAMDDVKNAKTNELAAMKAEIDRMVSEMNKKKDILMAELNEKKREMEEKLEVMENQIFLLDSQIYSILCYAGEVVRFGKVREGRNAPDDEPIVIHQKLRFLDEDLGQLASLYEIQWGQVDLFEHFLKHSPLALDAFAPNQRCVVLVRLSRTGTLLRESSMFPYSNMLEKYKYLHGGTVGIIIRNGDNLYLGWTDEDRVHIHDDLILTAPIQMPTCDISDTMHEYEKESKIKQFKAQRKMIADGIVSRAFVYNILQGVVDHSPILPLPKGTKLNKQSEYVLFSVADKWLPDNRFGSFNDIISRCNSMVMEGDTILTVQRLRPEHRRYNAWECDTWYNPRGRGERNRTRDAFVADCTLYPVNLVERDRGNTSVFVSVLKECSASGSARANFEVYEREYINLTYMNSTWLNWAITSKSLGDWRISGEVVSYAHAIRYLKTALDFIRSREKDELNILASVDESIRNDDEWMVKLSNWKLENKVRHLNNFQAKRFAKSLKSEKQQKKRS